jgi:hypothetical protein
MLRGSHERGGGGEQVEEGGRVGRALVRLRQPGFELDVLLDVALEQAVTLAASVAMPLPLRIAPEKDALAARIVRARRLMQK